MADNKDQSKGPRAVVSTMDNDPGVLSQILEVLKKNSDRDAIRLALDADPAKDGVNYTSVYKKRQSMIPPDILKRIRDNEEMIGGIIIPTRGKQVSIFANPRANRFDIGMALNIKPEAYAKMSKDEIEKIRKERLPNLQKLLLNCGSNTGYPDSARCTLSQYFLQLVDDCYTFGNWATEVRYDEKGSFHSFRPTDAATIFKKTSQKGSSQEAENIRKEAARILSRIENKNSADFLKKFQDDEYTWVQVIEDLPRQVFTDKEMLVMNFNPTTDINRSGYSISPIERVISAVTTHMNLTAHTKMYFINGRATRNIMVFNSDNLQQQDLEMIKNQMQAHINSVNAAWRMPVFGLKDKETINVVPIDQGNRDMEFQYLADLNKRMLFAAYQMSPDEVAALAYLSRGTNSQSLSESNNEYKLIANRDIGLRPLLLSIEYFINERLMPLIDPELQKIIRVDLAGMDADTPEKEATRLQQDSALYLTMDGIMERVEMGSVPLAGKIPLNPAYLQVLEKYFTKGEILKAFGGEKYKDADQNPELDYSMGDPTSIQVFMAKLQQQMQPQQDPNAPPVGPDGQPQDPNAQQDENGQSQDLDSAIQQLGEALGKSEVISQDEDLPYTRKELKKAYEKTRNKVMKQFEADANQAMSSISEMISGKKSDK
jgi:hypothetical protein